MGRVDQCSGGVITYPPSAPALLAQGAPRDYANVPPVMPASVLSAPTPRPVSAQPLMPAHHHHHRSSPAFDSIISGHRGSGMLSGSVVEPSSPTPTSANNSVDSMISLSLSTQQQQQCMLKQQQQRQLVQQYEDEHRELDRQHNLLRFKLLEIYRQKVNELNPFPAFSPPPVPAPEQHLTAAATTNHHRVTTSSSSVLPLPELSSTTSAFFVTATSSPFAPAPTLEVSAPILLGGGSPPPPAADPVRDSLVLEVTRSQLEQCGWYHGALSWQESDVLLVRTAHGTFLLRDSQYPGCLYSLSINQTERGPTSIRINFTGGRFRLDSDATVRAQMPAFSTVVELVEFYLNSRGGSAGTNCSAGSGDPNSAKNQVSLKHPLYKTPPTLAHMARLAINRSLASASRPKTDTAKLELPKKMLQYLNSYRAVV